MDAIERRREILTKLCQRRTDTCGNLAAEFGASERTIRNDIQVLACSYPIETVRGRRGGGIKITDWFSVSKPVLTPPQLALLTRVGKQLHGDDLNILNSIISQFSP